jgi:hypothetical protein
LPKTSKPPSPAPKLGSMSPPCSCSLGVLPTPNSTYPIQIRTLSDAEWERLNAEAIALHRQIVASPTVSAGDIWAKFKILEVMMDDNDSEGNALRADIYSALQNLAASEPQPTLIGDEEIVAKFREWCEASRYAETIGDDFASEPAYNDACAAAFEIEDYLVETPASGPIGLAIKVFLRHKDEHQGGPRGGDPCKLCVPVKGERDGLVEDVEESLLRDAVRFLPELAPLCAAVIGPEAQP